MIHKRQHNFLRAFFLALLAAILFGACRPSHDTNAPRGLTSENRTLVTNMRQIYSTCQMHSLQPYAARVKGVLAWQVEYNPAKIPGRARSLLIQDHSRMILDFDTVFFVVDLQLKVVMGSRPKDANSFLLLDPSGDLYYCSHNLLYRQKVDSFAVKPDTGYDLPGMGPYSELLVLVPGEEAMLVGVQSLGTPRDQQPAFGILSKEFLPLMDRWNVQFPGLVVRPPVSVGGTIVVPTGNRFCFVSPSGEKGPDIELPVSAKQCSIGPDDCVYLTGTSDSGSRLMAFGADGKGLWNCEIPMEEVVQPPLVDSASAVTLVGSDKIVSVVHGDVKWVFPIQTPEDVLPAASLANDGFLLLAAGRKVVCISPAGRVVWTFQHERDESFVVPPVIDSRGAVYVASDARIVVLQ